MNLEQSNKVSKINVILIICSVIIFFISMFSDRNIENIMMTISFIINIYVLISSIISIKKYSNKSTITIMIISLLLAIFFGFGAISGIVSTSKRNNYLKSEDFYIEQAKSLESSLVDSAKYYYNLEYYVENLDINNIKITKLEAEKNFNEKWFDLKKDDLGVCDGYVVININQEMIKNLIDEYKRRYNTDTYTAGVIVNYDYDRVMNSLNINAYISCNGDFSYTTNGYNN